LVNGNLAEEIGKMKRQPGKNLALVGGPGIAQTFMKLGLIDEYQIMVHPVILGSGKPLFRDLAKRQHLRLVGTKTYSSGAVGLAYRSTQLGERPA
jgi:dihydrofolate reductase